MMTEKTDEKLIFALDIGTRSVIGIVGSMKADMFHVRCMERTEYKNRAVVDGQIEDIGETAKVAGVVKSRLEEKLGIKLKNVYVAAAGRVLRTVEADNNDDIPDGMPITEEFISKLELGAIQKAYELIAGDDAEKDNVFFCVGHAVKQYLLDGYEISNLLDHKGKHAGVSLIVTFLPREIVESLYATMGRIELSVAGFTLEPIAAMNAIIPTDLRKLNLALCDVGAGTSDIALCDNGSVSAYTMATVAGDEVTEAVMRECLVDFQVAEQIKMRLAESLSGPVTYDNVLGFPNEEQAEKIFEKIRSVIEALAGEICEKILQINGRPPSAVFLVGGGSRTPMLSKLIAEKLGMEENRVAVGGNVYMKKMVSSSEPLFSPEYATPLGIALTAAAQRDADTFSVTINGEKLHLLNGWDTTVIGVLQMGGYRYGQIIGRTGKSVSYQLNGVRRTAHGGLSAPAEITLNGEPAALSQAVAPGDALTFTPAEQGEDARVTLADLVGASEQESFSVMLDDVPITAGRVVTVNGERAAETDEIKNGDNIKLELITTLAELARYAGLDVGRYDFIVNEEPQQLSCPLRREDKIQATPRRNIPEPPPEPAQIADDAGRSAPEPPQEPPKAKPDPDSAKPRKIIHVTLNGKVIKLEQRENEMPYQFFDLLNFADIDPRHPKGDIVQKLNGKPASYLDALGDGDNADIYWDAKK